MIYVREDICLLGGGGADPVSERTLLSNCFQIWMKCSLLDSFYSVLQSKLRNPYCILWIYFHSTKYNQSIIFFTLSIKNLNTKSCSTINQRVLLSHKRNFENAHRKLCNYRLSLLKFHWQLSDCYLLQKSARTLRMKYL